MFKLRGFESESSFKSRLRAQVKATTRSLPLHVHLQKTGWPSCWRPAVQHHHPQPWRPPPPQAGASPSLQTHPACPPYMRPSNQPYNYTHQHVDVLKRSAITHNAWVLPLPRQEHLSDQQRCAWCHAAMQEVQELQAPCLVPARRGETGDSRPRIGVRTINIQTYRHIYRHMCLYVHIDICPQGEEILGQGGSSNCL